VYRASPPKKYPPPSKNTAKAKTPLDIFGPGLEILTFDRSEDWWKLDELPAGLTDFLYVPIDALSMSPANYIHSNARITIFAQHKLQTQFMTLMPNLLHRLACYPPSHPSYPHPSLLNSNYLLSTFFLASPSHPSRIKHQLKLNVQEAENMLLKRVRMAIIEGVMKFNGQGEEVLDFILAIALVARYFYLTGRYSLGHNEGNGMMKLTLYDVQ
jgi:hypothetical protein